MKELSERRAPFVLNPVSPALFGMKLNFISGLPGLRIGFQFEFDSRCLFGSHLKER